jgi:hypothetical protein
MTESELIQKIEDLNGSNAEIINEIMNRFQTDVRGAEFIVDSILKTKNLPMIEIKPINTDAPISLIHLFKK